MLNLVKMELYRLFRSASTWVMFLVTIGMVVFAVSMTKFDVSNMEPGQVSEQREIGTQISEEEISVNIGIYAETMPEWATGEIKFSDLLSTQIGSGLFLIVVSIFVTIFVCAEQKNGYIKNIAGQFPNRMVLVFSKTVAIGVQVLSMFLVLTTAMFVTGKICFGSSFVLDSAGEVLKVLGGQFVLHYAFAAFLLCLSLLFHSSALSMTIGILVSCKVTSLLYAVTDRFSVELTEYALEINVTRFAQGADGKETLVMLLSAAVIFIAAVCLATVVMQKRDVR